MIDKPQNPNKTHISEYPHLNRYRYLQWVNGSNTHFTPDSIGYSRVNGSRGGEGWYTRTSYPTWAQVVQ
jgi:hypothetical protein